MPRSIRLRKFADFPRSVAFVGCLRAFLVALLLAPVVSAAQTPAQPTALTALHRDGQTFLTWTASTEPTVRAYQVYRHDAPITDVNLASATPIWRVTRGSSLFVADRYLRLEVGTWEPRYLERYVIENQGQELSATDELLVWTIAQEDVGLTGSGDGYYAVTTVLDDGTENTADITVDNTVGPVAESIAPPRPVHATTIAPTGANVFVQYLDLRKFNPSISAPRNHNAFYGLDDQDSGVVETDAYAFTYVVFAPECAAPAASYPVVLVLHGRGGQQLRPYDTFAPDPDFCSAYRIYPIDPANTWWLGGGVDVDYRLTEVPAVGDSIGNYTERRVLRMVDDLIANPLPNFPIDEQRLFVTGHSMGSTGALHLAFRYPQLFSAAYASQPMTDPETAGDGGGFDWEPVLEQLYGALGDDLPLAIDASEPYQGPLAASAGTPAWEWQSTLDLLQTVPTRDPAPFGVDHGLLDTVIEWPTQGLPLYQALNAAKLCWAGAVTNTSHIASQEIGLLPNYRKVGGEPFFGFTAVRDETVPALINASPNPAFPVGAAGAFNQNFEWSSSWNSWDGLPVDDPDNWSISLRCDVGPATVQVSPRRAQTFGVQPGEVLRWDNTRVSDGVIEASGTLIVPSDGIPITPPVTISTTGNRIRFQRPFQVDTEAVSVGSGGAQRMELALGSDLAGFIYIVLGSFSGTEPGVPLADATSLPLALSDPVTLTPDPYFSILLSSPNQPFLTPSFGTLDADGRATCILTVPAGSSAALAGTRIDHAFALVDPILLAGLWGSNSQPVDLTP
ncbi:MAG: alpha/beta hydrolase-fold protein [Planctomycetota bacterium]